MRPQRLIREHILLFIGALALLAFLALRWAEPASPTTNRQVSELALQLRDPSLQRRRQAAEALSRRPAEAGPVRGPLLAALDDRDLLVRGHAANALAGIRPPLIEPLMDALRQPSLGIRRGAAYALGMIGRQAAAAVPQLVEMLHAPDPLERKEAADALGRIGPDAAPALLAELNAGPPAAVGLLLTGLVAPMVVDGALNGELLLKYVRQELAPQLRPGDILIMDNLQTHKAVGVIEAVAERDARVLYLPPYSPDLNPIELAFSKVKNELRRRRLRTIDELWTAFGESLDWIAPDEARRYFQHTGYSAE